MHIPCVTRGNMTTHRHRNMATNINIGPNYQSRLNAQTEQAEQAQQAQSEKDESADTEKPISREEVMALINVLTDFVKGVATGIDGKFATIDSVNGVANKILQDINRRGYQNQQQVQDIAKDAVPPSFQGFDSDSTRKTGDTLKLISGATSGTGDKIVAVPSAAGGLNAKGTKTLYYGIFLREYDSGGNIVAPGSETGGAGTTLDPTWDVARWI